jgi:hypothetical protein
MRPDQPRTRTTTRTRTTIPADYPQPAPSPVTRRPAPEAATQPAARITVRDSLFVWD